MPAKIITVTFPCSVHIAKTDSATHTLCGRQRPSTSGFRAYDWTWEDEHSQVTCVRCARRWISYQATHGDEFAGIWREFDRIITKRQAELSKLPYLLSEAVEGSTYNDRYWAEVARIDELRAGAVAVMKSYGYKLAPSPLGDAWYYETNTVVAGKITGHWMSTDPNRHG